MKRDRRDEKSAATANRRDRAPRSARNSRRAAMSDGLFQGSGEPLMVLVLSRGSIRWLRVWTRAARTRATLPLAAHGARNARHGRKYPGRSNARGARGEKRARRERSTSGATLGPEGRNLSPWQTRAWLGNEGRASGATLVARPCSLQPWAGPVGRSPRPRRRALSRPLRTSRSLRQRALPWWEASRRGPR